MKKTLLLLISILFLSSACGSPLDMIWDAVDDDDDENNDITEQRVIEPTAKFYLATGEVALGRDELVIYDEKQEIRDLTGHEFRCESTKNIIAFDPRPDYDTLVNGSGAKLFAISPGIAQVTCYLDNQALTDIYQIIIPPQSLIQILVAEAKTQITDEATIENDFVTLASTSPTAEAIGMVINNRVNLIIQEGNPLLFNVDNFEFTYNPDASYFDSVIEAPNQFSPTNENDPSYDTYTRARNRYRLPQENTVAYDQAVLTAGKIYAGEIDDPTGGAFAFQSPNEDQWIIIKDALETVTVDMPYGSGVSDVNFPAFAPVQIVILNSVWKYEDGRPSFIFIRERDASDPAVVSF